MTQQAYTALVLAELPKFTHELSNTQKNIIRLGWKMRAPIKRVAYLVLAEESK